MGKGTVAYGKGVFCECMQVTLASQKATLPFSRVVAVEYLSFYTVTLNLGKSRERMFRVSFGLRW